MILLELCVFLNEDDFYFLLIVFRYRIFKTV